MENVIFDSLTDIPRNVYNILEKYNDADTYEQMDLLVKELNAIGWTVEYSLDCEPYNLHPIETV